MTTHDTPEATLALAIRCVMAGTASTETAEDEAAAILAALDGWTLVPSDIVTMAEEERLEAEVARLTRELDASRTLAAAEYADAEQLRTALRQIAATPKAHKLVASICEIALGPKLDDIHGTPTFSG